MGRGKKTASGETVDHRISFEVQERLEEFYTGGQVQVSKDGEYLFTSCGSAVKALAIDTGVVDHSFEEEEDTVICFGLSPDCKFMVVSWRSQQLKLYQWRNEGGEGEKGEGEGEKREEGEGEGERKEKKRGKCLRSWKPLQGAVVAMAIDPTSTLLATGSSSGIKVWDCVRHYCTHNLRPSGGLVGLLTFHPDPAHLTLFSSTATDTSIKVWDLKSSRCVSVMKGHVSAVTSVGFSADHRFMISGGRDKVLHVWKLPHYSLHKTLPVFEAVEGLVVLPEGSGGGREKRNETVESLTVATAGDKGVIRLWDMVSGGASHSLDPLPRPEPHDLQTSMSGKEDEEEEGEGEVPQVYTDLQFCVSRGELVAVTYDHSIIFYDMTNFTRQKQLLGYCDEILDMRFIIGGPGPAPRRLAIATNSEQVKVLTCGDSLDWQLLVGHSRVVLSLDVFCPPPPLRPLLVSSSKDHTIRVWGEEGSEGQSSEFICKGVGSGHTEAVGAVAFGRSSGSFVVSGSQDCTIKLWTLKSISKWNKGDPLVKLPTKFTQLAHDKDINAVDVSPNDKLAVTGSQDKTAKLWSVGDGRLVGVLRGHRRGIWSVQFSPVDQCVLTASADTTLKLWAVSDCSCIKTFEGHNMSVLKALFISRGMQIASSGSDGLVKIWTVRTNECVTTLDQHTEKVWSIASCEDGNWLASGGADSLICLWKDVTEKVVAEKQEARDRQILQEQELSNYLQQRDYVQAVGVAINLDQPFRVYTILSEVLDDGGEEGVFKKTLSALRPDQIHSVLRYLTKWNMNSKYSTVAQTVLSYILRTHTLEQLMSYGDLHSILEGLIPYTERHFQRLSRLLQLSTFVAYTWQCMKLPDQPSLSTTTTDSTVVASLSTTTTDSTVVASLSTTTTDSTVVASLSTTTTDSTVVASLSTTTTDSTVVASLSTTTTDSTVVASLSTTTTDSTVVASPSTTTTDSTVSPSTTTTDSTVVATRLPRKTKTRTGDGGAVDDVTIAAADSTAHDEGELFVEDRDPDPKLQLEHTTDNKKSDNGEGEETASDTEGSSEGDEEELEESSVHHEGGGGEGQSDSQSGSDTGGEERGEVGEAKRARVKRRVKGQKFIKGLNEEEVGEEEEEKGVSRCRRKKLLLRRKITLQRKLSGRQHRIHNKS